MADTAKLLQEARALRNARAKRTPEQVAAFEKSLSESGKDLSGGAPRKTVEEIEDPTTMRGSAKPADFIARYYGKEFPTQVAKAMLYNENRPTLEVDAYSRLFDEIAMERDPDEPRPAGYLPKSKKVQLTNKEGEQINRQNAETYREWAKSDDPKLRKRAEEFLTLNSYESADEAARSRDTSAAEHEFGHHYAKAAEGGLAGQTQKAARSLVSIRHKGGEDFADFHTADPEELTQAAGRFQRELFAKTGKRITDPQEFLKLVESDDEMEFMTPEAKRYLIFARRVSKEATEPSPLIDTREEEKKRKAILQGMADILPATVSVDESFEGRANTRLGEVFKGPRRA
jgi:hypothetical protein